MNEINKYMQPCPRNVLALFLKCVCWSGNVHAHQGIFFSHCKKIILEKNACKLPFDSDIGGTLQIPAYYTYWEVHKTFGKVGGLSVIEERSNTKVTEEGGSTSKLSSSGTSLYISAPVSPRSFVCFVWIIYKLFRRRPCFTICLYGAWEKKNGL